MYANPEQRLLLHHPERRECDPFGLHASTFANPADRQYFTADVDARLSLARRVDLDLDADSVLRERPSVGNVRRIVPRDPPELFDRGRLLLHAAPGAPPPEAAHHPAVTALADRIVRVAKRLLRRFPHRRGARCEYRRWLHLRGIDFGCRARRSADERDEHDEAAADCPAACGAVNPRPMAASSTSSRPGRIFVRGGQSNVVRLGQRPSLVRDLYHSLITRSWPVLFLLVAAMFLTINSLFALAYLARDGAIANARPGSFADAFFFSVHTFATIGYGTMSPAGLYGNLVVTVEALFGLLGFALATGLVFAKFAQPTAHVLFSRRAVIALRDGRPALMFRMANERANEIVEAHLRVVLVRDERSAEGETIRRLIDLPLLRDQTPLFSLTWTAVHPIDAASPLRSETAATLAACEGEIIVVLTGIDATFSQTVHARHSYGYDEIVWNGRFTDVLSTLPDGRRAIDYSRFHEVVGGTSVDLEKLELSHR
jgi:inward rectifier potassium channel